MLVVVSWILGLLLSVGFSLAGYAKVTNQEVMLRARQHFDLSANAYLLIGVAELAGAAGSLIGLVDSLAVVGFFAVLGLAVLMVGAISFHIRFGDQFNELLPALVMTMLSLLYLASRAIGLRG